MVRSTLQAQHPFLRTFKFGDIVVKVDDCIGDRVEELCPDVDDGRLAALPRQHHLLLLLLTQEQYLRQHSESTRPQAQRPSITRRQTDPEVIKQSALSNQPAFYASYLTIIIYQI